MAPLRFANYLARSPLERKGRCDFERNFHDRAGTWSSLPAEPYQHGYIADLTSSNIAASHQPCVKRGPVHRCNSCQPLFLLRSCRHCAIAAASNYKNL